MIDHGASPYAPPQANLDSAGTRVDALSVATAGSRLRARLVDMLLLLPTVIGAWFFASMTAVPRGEPRSPMGTGAILLLAVSMLYFAAVVLYQVVMLSTRGQTVGKRAMKIRIVKLDGSQPGFVHAFLLRMFVNGLPSAIPYVGGLYAVVDILFIFRGDKRCLHDWISGTRVVQAEAPVFGVAPLRAGG